MGFVFTRQRFHGASGAIIITNAIFEHGKHGLFGGTGKHVDAAFWIDVSIVRM
jgi:hypothetical protein